MLSANLEKTLHRALGYANERRHEYATLEHLLLSLAEDADAVSLTAAFAGIAETGTCMLLSGPESPTGLTLLPETHIVVLRVGQVVGPYEEAWARLRRRNAGDGAWSMPRTVSLITGPSRSADIEQTMQIGAHGPRRLHIVLVDGEPGP